MVQVIEQSDRFGKIGKAFGEGLGAQIPKEVERSRLSKGLQQFEQQSANLTPIQQLTRLSAIPGITPQMIQSFGELGRQQAKGQALKDIQQQENAPRPSPFPSNQPGKAQAPSEVPSLTKEEPFAAAQEGYIPPTQKEVLTMAGQQYNENPALFNNDPQKAIDFVEQGVKRDADRAAAFQAKHENLSNIQDTVISRLGKHAQGLGVQIPSNTYSKIEDKAIQATKPKSEGGRGLTEQQAMKEYGKELDSVSRDYKDLENNIGDWSIVTRPAERTLRSYNNLQENFEKRGDLENFADSIIAKNKVSPDFAYAVAYPLKKQKDLNSYFSKLAPIHKTRSEDPVSETERIAPDIASKITDYTSPLGLAYELDKRGYDAETFLKYVTDNREELNLRENQIRQLSKPRNVARTLNDWWLQSFTGLGE
jgi:hypothetical protein